MRCRSVFAVAFLAGSEVEARRIAAAHHEQIRDLLGVEGADHPFEISLEHMFIDNVDVLAQQKDKSIPT